MLHHIRKDILDKLSTAEVRRYSELKPGQLDGNVFGYHLKGLITDGYVTKQADGNYSLSADGRDYIVHRHEDPSQSAHSILLIVVKNGHEYLIRQRSVQPLLGFSGFIHGEPNPDLTVTEAARKRLLDKTGLDLELAIKGSALITQYRSGELQSYSHAVILYGETAETAITKSDATGINSWSTLEDVTKILPSCFNIVDMINSGETWLEKSYDID